MNDISTDISRRDLLCGTGALVVGFSIAPAFAQETPQPARAAKAPAGPVPPGSLKIDPYLDSWIKVDASGRVDVFTGKAELGQGSKTALLQVAAEELSMPLDKITITTADTSLTVNEGFTAGSHTMQDSGTAIRNAAAQVREILIGEASKRLKLPPEQLKVADGKVLGPNGANISYGDLVSGALIHVKAELTSKLKSPRDFRIMTTSVPRLDIPAKVTGGEAYVQDMKLPGMVHARVIRPPSYDAQLKSFDRATIEKMPGVVKVIRNGNFLAVAAQKEFQAIQAMRVLAANAQWAETTKLPDQAKLHEMVLAAKSADYLDFERSSGPVAADATTHEASYSKPYHSHGSIGPSCAVAHMKGGQLTVWTHTQGVYPDRAAIAQMLKMKLEQVRCIHTQGSGCYGHNGADDAAGDAAMIASTMPGTPVRLQWMREQELSWEPFGPAMATKARAQLSNGKIVDWHYEVWSQTHSTRPGGGGALLAAQHMENPLTPPAPAPIPLPEGGGDRNALPLYNFPNQRIIHHFQPDMPIRVSALRSLGAYMNVFSVESFMDELALAASSDPVQFRLAHLQDKRAQDVIKLAAGGFGWDSRGPSGNGRGYGFAFARYKNLAAYCALAMEVEVTYETGRVRLKRVTAAVDAGQIINPDGIRNQIEGAIIQSASWTLYEGVSFDNTRIISVDWATYPILRFSTVPDRLDVHLIDQPGQPFLGAGEAGQGPAGAAVANAIADATGKRLRNLPLSPERVKESMGT